MKKQNKSKSELAAEVESLKKRIKHLESKDVYQETENQNSEMLGGLFNYMPCGILQITTYDNGEHVINFMNHVAGGILEISPESKYDLDALFINVKPGEKQRLISKLNKAHKNKDKISCDFPIISKEVEDKYVRMVCKPIIGEQGFIVWDCVLLDITVSHSEKKKQNHLKRVLSAIRNVNQLIIKEKNATEVINRAVEILVESRGYFNAWIMLVDENLNYLEAAHAGRNDFKPLNSQLRGNKFPACVKKSFEKKATVIINSPEKECKPCVYIKSYIDKSAMTTPLMHEGRIFGVFSISIPVKYAEDEEEINLFNEVAVDLAYALYSIEQRENKRVAEKRLSESEFRFKKLFDSSPDGLFMHDLQGNILDINKKIPELFGYTKEKILSEKIFFFHASGNDIEKKARDAFSSLLETGHYKFEVDFEKQSGDLFTGSVNSSVIKMNGKKVIVGSLRDVTQRKKAELELEALEHKFRKLYENTPSGTMIIDSNYRITDVNEKTCEITGYSQGELVGQLCDVICPKGSSSKLCPIWEEGESSIEAMETNVKCKSGEEKPILKNAVRIDILGKEYIIENFQDISHLRNVEAKLKQTEYRRKLAMDAAKISWWEMHLPSGEIFFDDNKAKILGYNPEGFKHYDDFTRLIHPQDYDTSVNAMRNHLLGRTDKYDCEYRIKTKSGGYKWLRDVGGIVQSKGDYKLISGVVIDISEIKEKEMALSKQNDEYEKLNQEYSGLNKELEYKLEYIRNINADLKAAKEKAEESENLKSAFLANMCHEIRTPMSGILGFSELLKDADLTKDESKEFIDIIEQSGERMLNTINDLINISLIDAGQVEIKIDKVNVNNLVQELFNDFKKEAEMKNLGFDYHNGLDHSDAVIHTDETKLKQILISLLKNAFKFTIKGRVDFGYNLKGRYLEFSVKDTGIGIGNDIKDTIFERFRQGEITFSRSYEGAGLGLTIAKTYVEKLGGEISFTSNEGIGTSFNFTLPYELKQSGNIIESTDSKTAHDFSGYTVLVAEDDMVNYKYIEKILEPLKMKLIRAENGIEAVELTENTKNIDLIFMDIKMPKMNGYEATREIKKIKPEIPVIALSAYAMKQDRERAMQTGFDDFVTKPTNKERLKQIINKYLSGKIIH